MSAAPDIPDRGVDMLRACISAECEAMHRYQRPSLNPVFNDHLGSSDAVPAGLFVRLVGQSVVGESNEIRPNMVRVLAESKGLVIGAITSTFPDPSSAAVCDPRATLAEAWFQAMIELSMAVVPRSPVESLLVDTGVAAVSLLFYPSMGKTEAERKPSLGLSLDGPHSLMLTGFLARLFALGSGPLEATARRLSGMIPVEHAENSNVSNDGTIQSLSIVGAALFRGAQFSLPPWAVESFPEVYSCLFFALGRDPGLFGTVLRLSMDVRLSRTAVGFGSVKPCQLLSGPLFEGISDTLRSILSPRPHKRVG